MHIKKTVKNEIAKKSMERKERIKKQAKIEDRIFLTLYCENCIKYVPTKRPTYIGPTIYLYPYITKSSDLCNA